MIITSEKEALASENPVTKNGNEVPPIPLANVESTPGLASAFARTDTPWADELSLAADCVLVLTPGVLRSPLLPAIVRTLVEADYAWAMPAARTIARTPDTAKAVSERA